MNVSESALTTKQSMWYVLFMSVRILWSIFILLPIN